MTDEIEKGHVGGAFTDWLDQEPDEELTDAEDKTPERPFIRITETLSTRRDKFGWELQHTVPAKTKEGEDTTKTYSLFFSSFRGSGMAAVDRGAGESTDLKEILRKIDEISTRLIEIAADIKRAKKNDR